MGGELKGCPFCGCAMRFDSNRDWHKLEGSHEEHCVFDNYEPAIIVPAEDSAKSWAITTWNTRHGAGDAEDSARLDWLCTGNRKRVEDTITTGWFRVYHDVAPMSADHAEWRAMTEEFYQTTREAIDAARAGERG